jgi:hypothetical protein
MNTTSLYAVEVKNHRIRQKLPNRMDAIACGVQARFEERTGYTKKLIDTTVNVAKALGVPENEIQNWTNNRISRMINETERLREIKSMLEKHYDNSPGITT